MITPCEDTAGQVRISDGAFEVDAALLAGLLGVPAADVPTLMRSGAITSRCERGVGEHQGAFRLSFFHLSRRARLSVDADGRILSRSVVDFGDRPLPRSLHRPGE